MARQQGKAAEKSKGGKRLTVKKRLKDLEARKGVKGGALKKGTGVADDSV
jgi:hypothetical protein